MFTLYFSSNRNYYQEQVDAYGSFGDVDPSKYDGLMIPGGRVPDYILLNEHVSNLVRHYFEEKKTCS